MPEQNQNQHRPTVASNGNTPKVGMHTIHEDPDETNYTRYSKMSAHPQDQNSSQVQSQTELLKDLISPRNSPP